MKKIISGLLLLSAAVVFARDMEEEAVILNQELEYLKESAKIPAIRTTNEQVSAISDKRSGPIRTQSLEETYFGEEDTVSTKTAARKRPAED